MQKHHGLAYDLSLFEPQTAEELADAEVQKQYGNDNKVVRMEPRLPETAYKRKRNPVRIFGISLLMIVVAVIFSMILYNYVVLNEYNDMILTANKTISDQDNLKAQYQMKIDRSMPSNMIQEYAENKLNMTKANAAQKEFISLTEGDRGEVIREDEHDSFFANLGKIFHIG